MSKKLATWFSIACLVALAVLMTTAAQRAGYLKAWLNPAIRTLQSLSVYN